MARKHLIHWYRSWPKHVWASPHAHVVDNLPRIEIENYDYLTAERLPVDRPGFCLLEWDVALASEQRRTFVHEAADDLNSVLVAPYAIYDVTGEASCVHRDEHGNPIDHLAPTCATFGLGCIYLPWKVLRRFLADAGPLGFTDATFSRWHLDNVGPARVTWKVRPQHLHGD